MKRFISFSSDTHPFFFFFFGIRPLQLFQILLSASNKLNIGNIVTFQSREVYLVGGKRRLEGGERHLEGGRSLSRNDFNQDFASR